MTQDQSAAAPDGDHGEGGSRAAAGTSLVRVRTDRIVLVGVGLWLLALAVVLLVPGLHSESRHWWPWACVSGAVLGGLGYLYLRRGRGNAEDAEDAVRVPDAVRRQSGS